MLKPPTPTPPQIKALAPASGFAKTCVDVLCEVEHSYSGLAGYHEQLDLQTPELESLRPFLDTASDVLIATSRGGVVEERSAALVGGTGRARSG